MLIQGDALESLRKLVSEGRTYGCCVTSPPYFQMADYDLDGQYGLEETIDDYLQKLTDVFQLVMQLLPVGGVCWIVIGDTFSNYSPIRTKGERKLGKVNRRRSLQPSHVEKEPFGIPFRLAEALRADGWRHRNTIVWDKGSTGSVVNSDTGSCTHEFILQLVKWPGRKRMYANATGWQGSVIHIPPAAPSKHRCPFPVKLPSFLLKHTKADSVIDPFIGRGTTAIAAASQGKSWCGIDLDISLAEVEIPKLLGEYAA